MQKKLYKVMTILVSCTVLFFLLVAGSLGYSTYQRFTKNELKSAAKLVAAGNNKPSEMADILERSVEYDVRVTFISYQTNIESIGRQTLQLGSGAAMTTAQKHTLFELPFGVVGRYNFLKGSVFQPYAGLRIGADYAEMSSYYYTIQQYQDTWGVYLSPEIGVSIFPSPAQRFGFHVALFYSYASNNDDLLIYTMNNINRFGVRVGISF